MGTWQIDPFGNDDAMELFEEFIESLSLGKLSKYLEFFVDPGTEKYIQLSECNKAWASAEIIATLCGFENEKLSKDILSLQNHIKN